MECRECGASYRPGVEIDPCIGRVPGAYSACCGHGNPDHARILYGEPGNAARVVGAVALAVFADLRASGIWSRGRIVGRDPEDDSGFVLPPGWNA
jgi:hypothetical protein